MTPATPPATAATPGAAAAAAAAARPAGALAVTGQPLLVSAGQALAARVLATGAGTVELALAGGRVTAAGHLDAPPGATVRLVVADASAERVTLRVVSPPGPGAPSGAAAGALTPAGGPAAALAAAGLPSSAAGALLAALVEAGRAAPAGAALAALAGRAAAARVATPAQAAAFVRLEAAGLPATPAAVAGLATLLEGAPVGRALAVLADAAAARAGGPAVPSAEWTSTDGPSGRAAGTRPAAAAAVGSADWTTGRGPFGPSATAPPPGAPAPAGAQPALAALAAALTAASEGIAGDAASGDGALLRRAVADLLGAGPDARRAAGTADGAPLRALLGALASHPAAEGGLARAAAGLADALGAQGLAGAAVPPPGTAPDGPRADAAYLQLPLPGGATAELRVTRDGGRPGGGGDDQRDGRGDRRLAFLLHLSALGPVMIEATAGGDGPVEATVRAAGEEARRFLGERSGELADALRRSAGAAATVRVERIAGPPPERLLAPPPSPGLDTSA
ncbi:hypothetical protein [Miltoncostaea marina]|uniref:hypothetical protein n=1 Tax=Miltoncostaea marina TaxID=2843215 RepID=UPI001FE8658D|nr:hypothetical protein [Miltoncostaea marina]